MERIYLSFLGTNDYLPCTYVFPDGTDKPQGVRFVQEATVSYTCKDWGPEDQVVIFTTETAASRNWCDNGHKDRGGKTLERKGLKRCLSELEIGARVTQITIPEGRSEEELWKIFDKFLELIPEGAYVVFDVTHALRSIPMLAITALYYAKVIKGATIGGVYYGAFEVLGPPEESKRISLEKRRVPVFDLGMFAQLLDWSLALDRFLSSGDAAHACHLARNWPASPSQTQEPLRRLADSLERFSRVMSTCRGRQITEVSCQLRQNLQDLATSHMPPPFRPLLERLQNKLSRFGDDPITNGVEAAKWCLEHNLIQQGITILQEVLVEHLCRVSGGKPDCLDHRTLVSKAVDIHRKDTPENQWSGLAAGNKPLTKRYLRQLNTKPNFVEVFLSLGEARNDMNHAGFRESARMPEDFSNALEESICKVEALIGRKDRPQT